MPHTLLPLMFICMIAAINSPQGTDEKIEIHGTYRYDLNSPRRASVYLTLKEDGTFKHLSFRAGIRKDYDQTIFTGKYSYKDGSVKLQPEDVTTVYFSGMHTTSKKYKYKDGNTFSINEHYQCISWCNTLFLLSPQKNNSHRDRDRNDFEKFAECYNSGLSPKIKGEYLSKSTATQAAEKSCEPLAIGQIPSEFQNLFITKPIKAKVISISELDAEYRQTAKLNKGSEDGVAIGMAFYNKEGSFAIEITSTSQHTSEGNIHSVAPSISFSNDIDQQIKEEQREMFKRGSKAYNSWRK